jgi:hypothetical protein
MSPARSRNQAIAMNIAKAVQQGQTTAKPGSPSAQIAGSMAPSDVADFASTPQAGLPQRVAPAAPVAPPRAPKPAPVKRKPQMRVKNVGKPVKKMKFM